mmetsp:Transcript_164318/g.522581  ORF Transcript_164318/g.522581 Transcript_164318/m.522581 type:complete len:316 (-) Transcript_164318:192-1139(-)
MLFVVSASLRFHAKPLGECITRTTPRMNSKAKALAQELKKLEPKDIKKQLHVNDALAKEYAQHLGNFEGMTPVPCCGLYDSNLFNAFDGMNWDEEEERWANSSVRVFSGLYGMLRPYDLIQPLSLPVALGTKLTNSKGKFLRDFWLELVQRDLSDDLQKLPMPVIVNLAAEEDSQGILDLDALPEGTRIATVDFKTADKADAGSAKGEFLRWALETRCMTVEELLEFRGVGCGPEEQAAEYRVSPKKTSPDSLVFEEATGQGSGGGWSKKLAESGTSKTKFVKEFASGKQRYMRTEINKALVKESKKGRKNSEVY